MIHLPAVAAAGGQAGADGRPPAGGAPPAPVPGALAHLPADAARVDVERPPPSWPPPSGRRRAAAAELAAAESAVAEGQAWLAPAASRASSSTPPAARTPEAPARGSRPRSRRRSPASCRSSSPVACARVRSPRRVLAVPAVGVDVASGVEAPRSGAAAGARPHKDPFAVALFAKRARAARFDRPNTPAGPTPVHPGLVEADARGHWGVERDFGGRFVPETLVGALEQLEAA